MKDSEKKVEPALREGIKKLGGWCIKLLTNHITGLPDRLCLLPGGIIFFAETKSTGDKPSKIQLYVHRKLSKMGFKIFVIDSIEKLKIVLKSYE